MFCHSYAIIDHNATNLSTTANSGSYIKYTNQGTVPSIKSSISFKELNQVSHLSSYFKYIIQGAVLLANNLRMSLYRSLSLEPQLNSVFVLECLKTKAVSATTIKSTQVS